MAWFSGKCFSFILAGKHFIEVVKKIEISYYLLIMSNLVLKLSIAIYYVWIFFFSISSLKNWFNLIFILTLVLIFITIIYFSLVIFLIEIFYHQIWFSFYWLLLILFKIIYEIIIIIILISSSFKFFYLLDLISIILIIIYFSWDHLWN
jgi:hypothetical protein